MRAGEWIILSGQLGLDPATGALVSGVEAQARQALVNIASILGDCGASLADVAKSLVFVTDLARVRDGERGVRRGVRIAKPARSTVQVAALPAGAEVEIEVWAYTAGG